MYLDYRVGSKYDSARLWYKEGADILDAGYGFNVGQSTL